MTRYDRLSRFNHWFTACAFLGMLSVGFYMTYVEMPREQKYPILIVHKAVGVLLLVFAGWRVGYRISQGFVATSVATPIWQVHIAKMVHYALLLCTIGMPMSGLVMSLFSGQPTSVFGLVTIPAVDKIDVISGAARAVHRWVAYGFVIALVLHVVAALKHHFIERDSTLRDMLRG